MSGEEKAQVIVVVILIFFTSLAVSSIMSLADSRNTMDSDYDRDYNKYYEDWFYNEYGYYYEYQTTDEPNNEPLKDENEAVEEPDWFGLEKHIVEVPFDEAKPESSDFGLDINKNGIFEFLVVETNIEVEQKGTYHIKAKVCIQVKNNSCEFYGFSHMHPLQLNGYLTLPVGNRRVALLFPAFKINSMEENGPYVVKLHFKKNNVYGICDSNSTYCKLEYYTTNYYSFADFEKTRDNFQFFEVTEDYGLDLDNDGYYDNLTVVLNMTVLEYGLYRISTNIWDDCIGFRYFTTHFKYFDKGNNRVEMKYPGEQLYMMGLNGPYNIIITFYPEAGTMRKSTPATYYSLAYDVGYLRKSFYSQFYSYEDFDHVVLPVHLIGNMVDYGLDTDGDELYNNLIVNFDVQVDIEANYRITAYMYKFEPDGPCRNKTFVGYDQFDQHLDVGVQNIEVNISLYLIRSQGHNGTYVVQVQILPMANAKDPIFIFETSEYTTEEFD